VIHRDLKPPNIFICMEPDGRIVTTKVLDFGISVIVERGLHPSAGPALAMGTPAYMSPEHILGVPDIDGRTDVYGFGVLLYESLTGQMAFPGEPGAELFDRVLHQSAVPVTVARPDLPAGLVRIIEKAMAKDRDQRYSDVNSMVVALEDELMPPTPAPRLLTPQAGVPSFVARDARSEPHAPRAVLNQEPSGQRQGTQILFAFPLQTEGKEAAAPEGPSAGNCGSKGGSEEAGSLPTTDRVAALVGAPLRKTRSRTLGAHFALRGWGGLLGAGLAVAIGFFGVSVAMRGVRRPQASAPVSIANRMPPARERPALPASSAVPVAVSAPSTIPPSPATPSALAARESGHSVRPMRDRPVPATPTGLLVAERESLNDVPSRPHALRRASDRDQPAQAPSSTRRAGARVSSSAPRAGLLSKDDF
jgi:hypothetical protein